MTTDNIFSGLKVVDLASFIAGPAAAVILSDFGAEVIKVEPPQGELWRIANKIPPQPIAPEPYQWHLNNRNKRGVALDLKAPGAAKILRRLVEWADVLIVNTPHPGARSSASNTRTSRHGTSASSMPTSRDLAKRGRTPVFRGLTSPLIGGAAACCR